MSDSSSSCTSYYDTETDPSDNYAYFNGSRLPPLHDPLVLLMLQYYCGLLKNKESSPKLVQLQKDVVSFLRDKVHGQVWHKGIVTGIVNNLNPDSQDNQKSRGLLHIFRENDFYSRPVETQVRARKGCQVYHYAFRCPVRRSRNYIAFCKSKMESADSSNGETNEEEERYHDVAGVLQASVNPTNELKDLEKGLDTASILHSDVKDSAVRHVIVWTLHVSSVATKEKDINPSNYDDYDEPPRKRSKTDDCRKEIQAISVHVYLCEIAVRKHTPETRYILLWRECTSVSTEQNKAKEVADVINEGALSIARAVAMIDKLIDLEKTGAKNSFTTWEPKGSNCVKVAFQNQPNPSDFYMLKLFDNRSQEFSESPHLWMMDGLCDDRLEVEPFLLLHEKYFRSDSDESLQDCVYYQNGNGVAHQEDINQLKNKILGLSEDGRGVVECKAGPRIVSAPVLLGNFFRRPPFGVGAIVILRYKYVRGLHWPESSLGLGSPRSYVPILERLGHIHRAGFVHGDVRLFNMVFTKSEGNEEDSAILLDYDFGGREGQRKYPPHYSDRLHDVGARAGKSNRPMSFRHDLADLISILCIFSLESKSLEEDPSEGRHYLKAEMEEVLKKRDDTYKRISELYDKRSDVYGRISDTYKKELQVERKRGEMAKNSRDVGEKTS